VQFRCDEPCPAPTLPRKHLIAASKFRAVLRAHDERGAETLNALLWNLLNLGKGFSLKICGRRLADNFGRRQCGKDRADPYDSEARPFPYAKPEA
jgi:hypothetical protein